MKLFKHRVVKDGKEYYDLTLIYKQNNKEHYVRVRPCFWADMWRLVDVAELVEGE